MSEAYDALFGDVPVQIDEPTDRDRIVSEWTAATSWTPAELLGRLRYRLPGEPKLRVRFGGPNITLNLTLLPAEPEGPRDQTLSIGLTADRDSGVLTAEILRFDEARLMPVHRDQLLGNLQDLALGLGLTRLALRRSGTTTLEQICQLAGQGFAVDPADHASAKTAMGGALNEAGDIFLPRLTRLLRDAADTLDAPVLERLDREPDPVIRRILSTRSVYLTKPMILDLKDPDSARRFDRHIKRSLTPPEPMSIPAPPRF